MKKYCEYCNTEYSAVRISAKYCKDSCKTQANILRRENEKKAVLQEQQQVEINEKRRLKSEVLRIKMEQKAELTRISEEEHLKRQEDIRIAADELRLKNIQDAEDIAKRDLLFANNSKVWDAERLKRDRNRSARKSTIAFNFKVLGTIAVVSIGFHFVDSILSPKKD